jgi:voltage-gated sodium channel
VNSFSERARALVESNRFQFAIIALIIVNGIILGLETVPSFNARIGPALAFLDEIILWIFVAELIVRLFVYRFSFFKDPWSIFDFVIIGVSLMPAQGGLSVLRALRVLRVLRLISALPQLRNVVQGLIKAIPGLASIILIMALVFYVFAVMAVKLYGNEFPELFGSFGASLFTLFQIMTLEGWADIVREIMKTRPYAWIYFSIYILVSTFTVLNLFIAVIVDAMQSDQKEVLEQELESDKRIEVDLTEIHRELREIRAALDRR